MNDNGKLFSTLIEAVSDEGFRNDTNRALAIIVAAFEANQIGTGPGMAAMLLQTYKTIEALAADQCQCGECVANSFIMMTEHVLDVVDAGVLFTKSNVKVLH